MSEIRRNLHDRRSPRLAARGLRGFLALVAPLALACGGGGSTPTSPDLAQLRIASATISVDGQVVNGMTLPQGHGSGASTRFEASLVDMNGAPMAGSTVMTSYRRPAGMGMMAANGTMRLYDDGTHGDRLAGDGIYCYEDFAGDYGCHAADTPMGQYQYDFWGTDSRGDESNHMVVFVTVG